MSWPCWTYILWQLFKTFKLHSCYVPTFYDTLYFLGRQFGDTIYQRNLVTFFTHTANSYRGFLDTVKKCTWDNKHIKYSYTTFRWTSATLGTVNECQKCNRNLDTVKICIFGHWIYLQCTYYICLQPRHKIAWQTI